MRRGRGESAVPTAARASRRAAAAALLGAGLLLAPALAAEAAEEGRPGGAGGEHAEAEAGHGYADLLWEAGNLILLVGVLVYLARRPVRNYLGERRDRIRTDMEEAERLHREAEGRLAEWNERAARLDDEVEEIRRLTRDRAQEERERLVAEAERAAERIRRDAAGAVDRELQRAREALRREAAELAVDAARRILEERITAEDRGRLVDEFVARVEREGSARAEGA